MKDSFLVALVATGLALILATCQAAHVDGVGILTWLTQLHGIWTGGVL